MLRQLLAKARNRELDFERPNFGWQPGKLQRAANRATAIRIDNHLVVMGMVAMKLRGNCCRQSNRTQNDRLPGRHAARHVASRYERPRKQGHHAERQQHAGKSVASRLVSFVFHGSTLFELKRGQQFNISPPSCGYNLTMSGTPETRRSVRSYVRRTGRLTPGQAKALSDLWSKYGVDSADEPLDFRAIFGRVAPLTVDIGFGNGDSLIAKAADQPDRDFLGIEVHEPGVGHCLLGAESSQISNLRVVIKDAVEVLRQQVPDAAVDCVSLLFPDPWPKKRHHKRRIVQPSFLNTVADKLVSDGSMLIATDWQNYAEHIDEAIAACDRFQVAERREHAGDKPLARTTTKFEQRGLRKGHRIWDWRLMLRTPPAAPSPDQSEEP